MSEEDQERILGLHEAIEIIDGLGGSGFEVTPGMIKAAIRARIEKRETEANLRKARAT